MTRSTRVRATRIPSRIRSRGRRAGGRRRGNRTCSRVGPSRAQADSDAAWRGPDQLDKNRPRVLNSSSRSLAARSNADILVRVVAGWAQGKSWITPALLQERGNVAFGYLFPNVIDFQDPNFLSRRGDGIVGERLRRGYDFSAWCIATPLRISAGLHTALAGR